VLARADERRVALPAPELPLPGDLRTHHLVLPVAALIAAVPWLLEIDNVLWAALLAAHILLCAIGIVGSYATGLRPVRLVFFCFYLSWLGVGPLYQLSHERLAWGDSGLLRRTDAVTAALVLDVVTVLVVLLAGWTAGARRRPDAAAHGVADRPGDLRVVEPRQWAPWACLGLLGLLTPYVIVVNGGLGTLFASREDRVSTLSSAGASVDQGGGPAVALAVLIPAALAVVSAHLFILKVRSSSPGRSVLDLSLSDALGLAGALLGMVLFANPFSNTRFITLAAFGSVALALLRPRTAGAGRWMALAIGFVTLAAYPLSNVLAPDGGQPDGQSVMSVFAADDFDGFQQVINSMDFAHDQGFSLGRYVLSALFFIVPRSLWSGKATPSSIDVAEHRGYWFTNLSTPVHAEFYLEFGVVGVLLFAWLLGHLMARIDNAWLHRPGSLPAWVAPYACLAMLGFIRGPLGSLAPVWLTVIALLVLTVRRRPAPPDGAAPGPEPVPVVAAGHATDLVVSGSRT
jgi:hypothetical protein